MLRLLVLFVMYSYDDVREMAAVLLSAISSEKLVSLEEAFALSGEAGPDVPTVMERAIVMMGRTGRADHADGVGRICGLLFERSSGTVALGSPGDRKEKELKHLISTFENDIKVALSDLPKAVLVAPLHGSLISLR